MSIERCRILLGRISERLYFLRERPIVSGGLVFREGHAQSSAWQTMLFRYCIRIVYGMWEVLYLTLPMKYVDLPKGVVVHQNLLYGEYDEYDDGDGGDAGGGGGLAAEAAHHRPVSPPRKAWTDTSAASAASAVIVVENDRMISQLRALKSEVDTIYVESGPSNPRETRADRNQLVWKSIAAFCRVVDVFFAEYGKLKRIVDDPSSQGQRFEERIMETAMNSISLCLKLLQGQRWRFALLTLEESSSMIGMVNTAIDGLAEESSDCLQTVVDDVRKELHAVRKRDVRASTRRFLDENGISSAATNGGVGTNITTDEIRRTNISNWLQKQDSKTLVERATDIMPLLSLLTSGAS
jgi:hypothetical protein